MLITQIDYIGLKKRMIVKMEESIIVIVVRGGGDVKMMKEKTKGVVHFIFFNFSSLLKGYF